MSDPRDPRDHEPDHGLRDPDPGDSDLGDSDLSDPAVDRIGRGLDVPDHGASFWAELDRGLHAQLGADPGVHDAAADAHGPTTSPHPNEEPIVMPFSTVSKRTRTLMAAAAAVVLLLVGGLFAINLGGDDDPTDLDTVDNDSGPSTPEGDEDDPTAPDDDTDADDGTTPTSDPADGDDENDTDGAGSLTITSTETGTPVAVDPTSTHLYVTAQTDDALGCEGAPMEALHVRPVDGDGDEQLALADFDATGRVMMSFGPERKVALTTVCEGFNNDLTVGRIADDGTIEVTAELEVPDVDGITDITWVDANTMAVSTIHHITEDGGGDPERATFYIPDAPSEPSDADLDGAIALEMTSEGLASLHTDGTIRVAGDGIARLVGASDLVVSPDGNTIGAFGQTGMDTFGTDGGNVDQRFADPVAGATMVNGVIGYQSAGEGTGQVITAGVEPLTIQSPTFTIVGVPDGSRVYVSLQGDDGAGPLYHDVTLG